MDGVSARITRTPAREDADRSARTPANLTHAGKGRKPGVPNRVTRRVRDAIAQALTLSGPSIARWLQQVGDDDPRMGLQVVAALARLALPKASIVETGGGAQDGISTPVRAHAREVSPAIAHARARFLDSSPAPAREPQASPHAVPPINLSDAYTDDNREPYNPLT